MAVRAYDGVIRQICLEDRKRGGKIIYRRKNGIGHISIPEDYTRVEVYIGGPNEDIAKVIEREPVELDTGLLRKVERNRKRFSDPEEEAGGTGYTEQEEQALRRLGNLEALEFESVRKGPSILYEDITDCIMFGFPAIGQGVLAASGGGLWANHGIRRFHIKAGDLLEDVNDSKVKALVKLYFDRKDSGDIPPLEMSDFRPAMEAAKAEGAKKDYECFAYIDTNKLGGQLEAGEQSVLFGGYFELTFQWEAGKYADITYCFPVELNVNNTMYTGDGKSCPVLQDKTISIDFGTSSSCVAVEGENGIELLTLSSDEISYPEKQINIYENPTYAMIYRWGEIYAQWRRENGNFPFLVRGDREEEFNAGGVYFDFGYSVKNCMDEVSEEELNAILAEIKMIPYVLHSGRQLSVRPFIKTDKQVVKLVSSPEEEDGEHFDPVAFYAYILGRAINNVAKNKIYTKFNITYPVKFDGKLREKIRHSFAYGLKRSLPLPLRDADIVRVEMKRAEPVAYIGAICTRYLRLKDGQPELFAVFDFGGGTLDYSFGIFAKDPEYEENAVIHILHVDGDSNIGGETLIKRLSYWIYTSTANANKMIENNIPFEMPSGEIIPNGFGDKFFNESMEAQSNVRKINEKISRKIFEGEIDENSDTEPVQVELMTLKGEKRELECNFSAEELNAKLEKVLSNKVEEFGRAMDAVFEKHEGLLRYYGGEGYSAGQVNIYMSGNASKNKKLRRQMEAQFGENCRQGRLWLVDETDKEFMAAAQGAGAGAGIPKENKVAITPKTAVAIGQVYLQKYWVIEEYLGDGNEAGAPDAPFLWYIGNTDMTDGSFKIKIERSSRDSRWVKYCRVNAETAQIYYSQTREKDGNSGSIHSKEIYLSREDKGKYLYLRIAGPGSVEYAVCSGGDKPDDGAAGIAEKIITLG